MVKKNVLTWNEFKQLVQKPENLDWIYRGLASEDWELKTTLHRFIKGKKEKISAKEYHEVIKQIISADKIRMHPDFEKMELSDESPFKIGLLYGNSDHFNDLKREFHAMIQLRHLGFPSPLLDWTEDPYIAAFFSCVNVEIDNDIAIYRSKFKSESDFSSFGLSICNSNFFFDIKDSRHEKQKSIYTLAVYQGNADMVVKKENRKGPFFDMRPYEHMNYQEIEIEKYIIKDSKHKRLDILSELYNEKGISLEALYGDTHILENTVLKDLAIKKILLSNMVFF